MAHTPGPWEAHHVHSAGWEVRRQHERPGWTGLAPICAMAWWQFDIPGIIDDEISESNARLIAAAPDLLAVCEELEASAAYWSEYDVPLGIVDRLKAAIKKAKVNDETTRSG